MALAFQGWDKASREWGMVTKMEIKETSGSFQIVGIIDDLSNLVIEPLTIRGDPSDTEYVQALRVTMLIAGQQTKKAAELANLAGVTAAGLFDSLCQVKFTLSSGRTLLLGAVSGYPMRVHGTYYQAGLARSSYIVYGGTQVEPYSAGIAGKFSA